MAEPRAPGPVPAPKGLRYGDDARTPLGPPQGHQKALYRTVRFIFRVVFTVLGRVELVGAEKLPQDGAYVVAPVHRSNVDFALLSLLTKRRMRFMGKDAIWKSKVLGRSVSVLGAFPVHRGAPDREAMRVCHAVLQHGEPLVMFAEGTRQQGGEVGELFDGTAYVAARAGVTLYPVGIGGSQKLLPKGAKRPRLSKLVVVVGDPIEAPPSADAGGGGARRVARSAVRQNTLRLRRELQSLYDRAQALAGDPNPPRTQTPAPVDLDRP
ncbi:MAG: 1-acyl-sn-glycerol-3-phosphate acyltransferase [Acidimicrobiia bacterium]|nr:1-acyl-sn-glycerol-3-phosphate acyltransferase [Acidimicrobiia bacterium]